LVGPFCIFVEGGIRGGAVEDKFKERISAALMGDLLVELAKREKIKKLLGDMDGLAADELVKQLLDDFEQLIEERHRQLPPDRPVVTLEEEAPPSPALQAEQAPVEPLSFSELFAREWDASVPLAPVPPAGPTDVSEAVSDSPGDLPPIPLKPLDAASGEDEGGEIAKGVQEIGQGRPLPTDTPEPDDSNVQFPPEEPPLPPPKIPRPKVYYDLEEDEHFYFHGVSMISPDEPPSPRPFLLEEKGIEEKDAVFALDHRGLRFYLSRIHTRSSNVSKAGILLLNKHESIMMRCRHESILNELRAHGVVLPVEFGTVGRGKDELLEKIDSYLVDLHLAVEDMAKTVWWDVGLYVLDARAAQHATAEGPARHGRERSRSSYSATTTSARSDIKALERILNKQKKIAEEVHEELNAKADRSDVDMMISLGGGTSEDWKQILKASYEVPPSRLPAFNRVVTDIQSRHFAFDMMLVVAGERKPFSFQE